MRMHTHFSKFVCVHPNKLGIVNLHEDVLTRLNGSGMGFMSHSQSC